MSQRRDLAHGLAAAVAPGNLLEMWVLSLICRPTHQELHFSTLDLSKKTEKRLELHCSRPQVLCEPSASGKGMRSNWKGGKDWAIAFNWVDIMTLTKM